MKSKIINLRGIIFLLLLFVFAATSKVPFTKAAYITSPTGENSQWSQWTTNGSSIYYNNPVGIGTTTPSTKFQVLGGSIGLSNSSSLTWRNSNNLVEDGEILLNASNQLVLQSGTGDATIFSSNNGTTEWMRIISGGNVGVGITNPNSLLHLYKTSGNAELDIQGVAGTNNHWGMYNNSADNSLRFWGAGDWLTILRGGNIGIGTTNPGSKLVLGSGQVAVPVGSAAAPSYTFSGETGTGIFRGSSGYVGFAGNGNGLVFIGSTLNTPISGITKVLALGGAIDLGDNSTNYIYKSSSDNMILQSSGSVGIGTVAPVGKLHVVLAQNVSNPSNQYAFTFDNQSYSGAQAWGMLIKGGAVTPSSNILNVQNSNSGSAFIVKGDGNVGIGITNPSIKLSVSKPSSGDAINVGGGQIGGLDYTQVNDDQAVSLAYLKNNYTSTSTVASNSLWGGTPNGNIWNGTSGGGNVGIGTTNPLSNLQIGTLTSSATTTPKNMSLGGTYSNVASGNAKLKLYESGVDVYGLGVSPTQFDFMIPSGAHYSWNINNQEKVKISSLGYLGLGLGAGNEPSSMLTLGGGDGSGSLSVFDNNPMEFFTVDENKIQMLPYASVGGDPMFYADRFTGNVGIGTTNPGSALHVSGSSSGASPVFKMQDTNTAHTALSNNTIGQINFIDTANSTAGKIVSSRSSTWNPSTGYPDGDLSFWTRNSYGYGVADGSTEKMRISAAGKVGIGTTNPLAPLHIKNNAGTYDGIKLDTSGTGAAQPVDINLGSVNAKAIRIYASTAALTGTPSGAGFQLYNNSATDYQGQVYFDSGADNNASLNFRTTSTGGTITNRMRIDAWGNTYIYGSSVIGANTNSTGAGLFIGNNNNYSDDEVGIYDDNNGYTIAVMDRQNNRAYYGGGYFYSDLNSGKVIINKNLGVGVTNPTSKLDINGDVNITPVNSSGGLKFAGANASKIYSDSGTAGLWLFNPTGTSQIFLGTSYDWDKQVAIGYTPGMAGAAAGVLAIGQINKNAGTFTHGITALYTNGLERLRINSSGRIGIGTTNPDKPLTVVGSNNVETPAMSKILSVADSADNTKSISLGYLTTADAGMIQSIDDGIAWKNTLINPNGGDVGIGTTTPGYKLTVAGEVGATAFTYTSDRSLKKNIETIKNPLNKILNLRGVTFNWKADNKASVGLIAQEVETVFPELVTEANGIKSVQYGNLVAPLVEAVKAQQKEINNLEARIKILERRK